MEKLLGGLSLSSFNFARVRNDDDFIDRLNHRYTTVIFGIFAIVVTSKQYSGEPINCWCPAYFTSNYIDYTNKICWVSNTYHVPLTARTLPHQPDPGQMINYYQWIPIILLFQALLFQLPNTIWQSLNSKAGVDIRSIIDAGSMLQSIDQSQNREKLLEYMIRQITGYLGSTPDRRKGRLAKTRQFVAENIFWFCGRSYGTYLVGTYMTVKFLYMLNAILQLVILNAFIRRDYNIYGFEVIQQLLGNEEFAMNLRFPRVTWCDFKVRQLKTVHHHTVQCVLPINLFNEKIFIFIWFWLVLVAIVTAISFLAWCIRCILHLNRVDYVKLHLKRSPLLDNAQKEIEVKKFSPRFARDFLKPDGILILRLLEENANQIVTVELLVALWNNFRSAPVLEKKRRDEEEALEI